MRDLGNYEAQSELLSALRSNEELSKLVTGGYHNLVANKDAPFPRVVYTEINNTPTGYADGDEVKATVNFQLSIFADKYTVADIGQINRLLDKLMKDLEYKKYDSVTLYEDDTELYHKALRYTKNYY